jgi:PIN domain nuclease of toxin-antitoxin system
VLVLDTHAAVWWTVDPRRLGRRATIAINDADRIGIPAIVFWEVSLLVRKARLALDMPVSEWAEKVQLIPRVESIPLTAEIAIEADALEMHADPADRFIIATARRLDVPVVTKDRSIRSRRIVKTIW